MGNKQVHQVGEGDHTCLEITDGGEAPGNVKRAEDKPLYLGGKRTGISTGLCPPGERNWKGGSRRGIIA